MIFYCHFVNNLLPGFKKIDSFFLRAEAVLMNFFRVASLRIKGITSVPPAESHLCSVVMETFRFNHFVCKPIKAPTQYL